MAKKNVLPAHQARSRESLRKLLRAATEILGRHGVEGTTIPRIARHAGLTPGSVYRRFHDKDALIETAILGILERQEEVMKTSFAPLVDARTPLPVFAGQIIGGMVGSYRANAALLRGLRQFMQSRAKTEFWKKVSALETSHFQRVVELFLSYREEITHPDPRNAVSMGLIMVVGTLYQVLVWTKDQRDCDSLFPTDDQFLKRELTRAFLSYLGVDGESAQRS